ncbi:MAG: hypothetical protein KDA05_07900 [Phycisphaerales bacterium]|nr:hypothetical protein [Phycisphaerales bacterium]
MPVTPLSTTDPHPLARAAPTPSPLRDRQESFLQALGRHDAALDAAVPSSPFATAPDPLYTPTDALDRSLPAVAGTRAADPARAAAEQFVATTFLMPVLKEIRAQNNAAAPFGPTQAEKSLGPLMDAMLADRMVKSHQFALVDRIAADLRRVSTDRLAPDAPQPSDDASDGTPLATPAQQVRRAPL